MNTVILKIIKRIPLYITGRFLTFKIYFKGIMPVLGYWHILNMRSIATLFYPLTLMFAGGIIFSLLHHDFVGVARGGQVLGMIFFADYLAKNFILNDYITLAKRILYLFSIFFIFEWVYQGAYASKEIYAGIKMYRFLGLLGESNYSAVCIAIIGIFLLTFKQWKFYIFSLVLLLFTASRVSMVIAFLGSLQLFYNYIPKKLWYWGCYILLSLIVLFPLELYLFEHFASNDLKLWINHILSARYVISVTYLHIFLHNPFGIGFFQGEHIFNQYAHLGSSLITEKLYWYPINHIPVYEQHNLFMQTLSEFGIWGYFLLTYFLFSMVRFLLKVYPNMAYTFILTWLGFMTLNGYSEFVLYFISAISVYFCTNQIVSRYVVNSAAST